MASTPECKPFASTRRDRDITGRDVAVFSPLSYHGDLDTGLDIFGRSFSEHLYCRIRTDGRLERALRRIDRYHPVAYLFDGTDQTPTAATKKATTRCKATLTLELLAQFGKLLVTHLAAL